MIRRVLIGDAHPYRFISGGGGGGSSSGPGCVVDLFSSPKPDLCDKAILCWWLVVRGCFAPFQDSIKIGNHDSVGLVAATRHLLCEFEAGRTGEKGRKLCFPKGSDDDANVPQSKHPDLFVVELLTFHMARFQIFFLFPHEAKLYNASHKDHSIGPALDNPSSLIRSLDLALEILPLHQIRDIVVILFLSLAPFSASLLLLQTLVALCEFSKASEAVGAKLVQDAGD
jgi:hypothetical protein